MACSPVVWTVGHSNHDLDAFAALVASQQVDYLVDIRSYPYSRHAPHFNRDALHAAMRERGVAYVFLGASLGGRPQRDALYDDEGHALYGEMAKQPAFSAAIDELLRGAHGHRLALLCSCGQPRDCHRRLLVGKVLCERGAELRHVLPDGTLQIEHVVALGGVVEQDALFGHDAEQWRSARSVSHGQWLSTSSAA